MNITDTCSVEVYFLLDRKVSWDFCDLCVIWLLNFVYFFMRYVRFGIEYFDTGKPNTWFGRCPPPPPAKNPGYAYAYVKLAFSEVYEVRTLRVWQELWRSLSAEFLPAGRCRAARRRVPTGSRWRQGWRWRGWTCSEVVAAAAGRAGQGCCRLQSTPGWRTASADPTVAPAAAGSQSPWRSPLPVRRILTQSGRWRHPTSSFPACLRSTSDRLQNTVPAIRTRSCARAKRRLFRHCSRFRLNCSLR